MANKSKFGIGLIIGAIGGALAGIFLSPKSGKENREEAMKKYQELKEMIKKGEVQEKAREVFGDVSEQSVKLYKEARDTLIAKLDRLRDSAQDIDREKYKKLVEDVVDDLKGKSKTPSNKLERLKKYLAEDWGRLMGK